LLCLYNYTRCFFIVVGLTYIFSLSGCSQKNSKVKLSSKTIIDTIIWHDGDSGTINRVPFILANVDAPEIQSNFQNSEQPGCAAENTAGEKAKSFFSSLNTETLSIRRVWGITETGEHLVSLDYDSTDIALIGIGSHMLAERRLSDNLMNNRPKPNWCNYNYEPASGRNPDFQFICFSQFNVTKKSVRLELRDDTNYCKSYLPLYETKCQKTRELTYEESVQCVETLPEYEIEKFIRILDTWY